MYSPFSDSREHGKACTTWNIWKWPFPFATKSLALPEPFKGLLNLPPSCFSWMHHAFLPSPLLCLQASVGVCSVLGSADSGLHLGILFSPKPGSAPFAVPLSESSVLRILSSLKNFALFPSVPVHPDIKPHRHGDFYRYTCVLAQNKLQFKIMC